MRKANLERLLARRPEGIFINPFERGEIGPDPGSDQCDDVVILIAVPTRASKRTSFKH
jgi:hypothetical protein